MRLIVAVGAIVTTMLSSPSAHADVVGGPGAAKPARPGQSTQEKTLQVAANVAVGSDYVSRGVSQTANNVLLNTSAELGIRGFYTGVSTFSVNFRREGNRSSKAEIDLYGGYEHQIGAQAFDVGVISYFYPPQPAGQPAVDYVEFYGKTGRRFGHVVTAASVYYTPQGSGASGTNVYSVGSIRWDISKKWVATALAGYQYVETGGSYTDWNAGVTRTIGQLQLDLRYWDTDHHRIGRDYGTKFVFTATLGF